MARRAALVSLLVFAACGIPGPSTLRYGPVYQPAGSRTVYFEVRKEWTEYLTVDGNRKRWKKAGTVAVDLDTFRTHYERRREFYWWRAYDRFDRAYYDRELGNFRSSLLVCDRKGKEREILKDGPIESLAVALEGEKAWVFYFLLPVDAQGRIAGTYHVVRVDVDTKERRKIPLPARRTWDWLTVQNKRYAFVTGRRGARFQTWRADFEKNTLGDPIDGDFLVLDEQGTLVERRDNRMFAGGSGLPPTALEIIRKGERRTIDVGLPGRVFGLFNTGRVVLHDPKTDRYVIRSLEGAPDRWLPNKPPTRQAELKPE